MNARDRRHGLMLAVSLGILASAGGLVACRSHQQQIQDQQQALTSLRATVAAVGNAWLAGSVSSTYTRTALEATQRLVEKERTELTASPELLASADGIALSESEHRLEQQLALLWKAVDDGDTAAVQRHVSAVAERHDDSP